MAYDMIIDLIYFIFFIVFRSDFKTLWAGYWFLYLRCHIWTDNYHDRSCLDVSKLKEHLHVLKSWRFRRPRDDVTSSSLALFSSMDGELVNVSPMKDENAKFLLCYIMATLTPIRKVLQDKLLSCSSLLSSHTHETILIPVSHWVIGYRWRGVKTNGHPVLTVANPKGRQPSWIVSSWMIEKSASEYVDDPWCIRCKLVLNCIRPFRSWAFGHCSRFLAFAFLAAKSQGLMAQNHSRLGEISDHLCGEQAGRTAHQVTCPPSSFFPVTRRWRWCHGNRRWRWCSKLPEITTVTIVSMPSGDRMAGDGRTLGAESIQASPQNGK